MPPLIVITGETASGKSELALQLAERHNGEIICADSWTVRRQQDIGTAKPSMADQAKVPHHLLDIIDPAEDYTAAVFKRQANEAITDISQRSKLPILVGGTGLYIDGVIFDYNFLPAGQPGQRATLDRLTIKELLELIAAAGLDLRGIDIRNKRRLIRLLQTRGAPQTRQPLRHNTLVIGLQPDRETLKQRITDRVDTMLTAGLEQEVSRLARQYGWNAEGLKGIGYREWHEYFEGSTDLETTRQRIISSTVGLAKRQRTWFKRNKSIHWFFTPVSFTHVDELVTTFLNN